MSDYFDVNGGLQLVADGKVTFGFGLAKRVQARLAKLENVTTALASVLSEEGVKEFLSSYVMGVEVIDRMAELEDKDA